MKCAVAIVGALIVAVSGAVYVKLHCYDAFNAKCILRIRRDQIPERLDLIAQLKSGYYCACEMQIRALLATYNVSLDERRRVFVLANYEFKEFRTREFHAVKGEVVRRNSKSEYIFVYCYNARYDLPYDIELKAAER